MPVSATPAKSVNTIEGEQELTINIYDMITTEATLQQVLELCEQAAKMEHIHIDISSYFRTLEEAEELAYNAEKSLQISNDTEVTSSSLSSGPCVAEAKPDPTSIAAFLCAPITTILTTTTSHAGSLSSFTWPAFSHTDRKFTRPPSFWEALYAHASTLETLHLNFFCHEVRTIPHPPANVKFGKPRDLRIDASSAHGDDGSAIDDLLGKCENIEVLSFEWPPCDFPSCRIKGVSWAWTSPQLRQLSVFGWNFAPAAYIDFLARHPGIRSLDERVDGPYGEDGEGYAIVQLPITALPNLRTLKEAYTHTHPLSVYFDTAADRPLGNLMLYVKSYSGVEQGL
ncbi:hypothetical protein M3J09_002360 [Ascochyta lentis]